MNRSRSRLLLALACLLGPLVTPAAAQAAGSISGTVTEEATGNPIEGICVGAQETTTDQIAIVDTGLGGEYTFAGLAAGEYRVQFNPPACSSSDPAYTPEYWQDTTDINQAAVITVTDEVPVEDVNAVLATAATPATGSIAGTVTDENGAPIQGICVGVQSTTGGPLITQTGADGEYAFEGLPEGQYRVQFNPPPCPYSNAAYVAEYWQDTTVLASATVLEVADDTPVTGINAALASAGPTGSISGTVTRDGGGGAPLASICVSAQGPTLKSTTTDSDGEYTLTGLAAGSYRLSFSSCGQSNYIGEYYNDTQDYFQATMIELAPDEDEAGINAALILGGSISGTVTASGGAPAVNECVIAHDAAAPGQGGRQAITGSGGEYTLTALPPGDYKLSFSSCGFFSDPHQPQWWDGEPTSETADVISIEEGETEANKDATLIEGGRISGHVSHAGSDVADVCVLVTDVDETVHYGSGRTDAEGNYTVQGLPTGSHIVHFNDCAPGAPDYAAEYYDDSSTRTGAEPVPVTAPATTSGIDAVLGLASRISGTLTLPGGGPAALACVGIYPASADDVFDLASPLRTAVTDSNGSFSVVGLDPATYKVAFGDCQIALQGAPTPSYAIEAFSDEAGLATASEVVVAEGADVDLSSELELGGRISGSVTDEDSEPIAGVCVAAEDPETGDAVSGAVTATDGSFTLAGVPEGSWAVRYLTKDCERATAAPVRSEYHDDAADLESATPAVVAASGTTDLPDAELAEGVAPQTTITSGPAEGSSSANDDPAFGFTANEAATFECKLDGGSFAACTSPKAYADLSPGAHTFSVRAIDTAGNVDATPSTRAWTINVATQTETTEGTAPPQGTVTTDPQGTGPTPQVPVVVGVTTPSGGDVTIAAGPPSAEPQGFELLGTQLEITAPPATVADPLRFVFVLDAASLPAGVEIEEITVLRNGAQAGECPGSAVADPNPCVSSRTLRAGGDLELVVLSSHASTWNLAVAKPATEPDPGPGPGPVTDPPPGSNPDPGPGPGPGPSPPASPGPADCIVPKLKGLKLGKAKKKIERTTCELGKLKRKSNSNKRPGVVLKQEPKAGTVKPAGTKVKLVVSKRG